MLLASKVKREPCCGRCSWYTGCDLLENRPHGGILTVEASLLGATTDVPDYDGLGVVTIVRHGAERHQVPTQSANAGLVKGQSV